MINPALESLLKKERNLWRGQDQYYAQNSLSTGYTELDKSLPCGGWSTGSLTELLPRREGIGEFSLLLPALKELTTNDQWIALVNPPHIPYAPALANAGIALERMLVVDTGNDPDTLWATEQLLRSGTFSAVINWVEKSSSKQLRRLQLAAENSECWAVAYRNVRVADQPSPAALRIILDSTECNPKHNPKHNPEHNPEHNSEHNPGQKKGLQLELIKVRGGATQKLVIEPGQFDSPQGIEWPASSSTRSIYRETP